MHCNFLDYFRIFQLLLNQKSFFIGIQDYKQDSQRAKRIEPFEHAKRFELLDLWDLTT